MIGPRVLLILELCRSFAASGSEQSALRALLQMRTLAPLRVLMVRRVAGLLLVAGMFGCGAEVSAPLPSERPPGGGTGDAHEVIHDRQVNSRLSGELLFTVDGCGGPVAFLPEHIVLVRCDPSTTGGTIEKRSLDGSVIWARPIGSTEARYLDARVVALDDGSVRVAFRVRDHLGAPPTWRVVALSADGSTEWERELDMCGPRELLADRQGTLTFTEGLCYGGFPDAVVRLGRDGTVRFRLTDAEVGLTGYLVPLAAAVSPRGDVIVGQANQGYSGEVISFVRLGANGDRLGKWTASPWASYWAPLFLDDSGAATGEIQGVMGDVPDNRLFVTIDPTNRVDAVRYVPFGERFLAADGTDVLTGINSETNPEGRTLLRWRSLRHPDLDELVVAQMLGVTTPPSDGTSESYAGISSTHLDPDGSVRIAVFARGRGSIDPAGLAFEEGLRTVFLRVRR